VSDAPDRRDAILDRLADHVLAEGLAAASLRPLARAVGTSDRMLLYYFKDKAAIITAVIERVSTRLALLLAARRAARPLALDDLRRELLAILFADDLWPYMRLWLEIASMAARDPFYRQVGESIARGFLAWGAAQLDAATPAERAADAAKLLVMTEGAVLLRSVGLEDVVRAAF
jgi:AcrR family transcriptional regulator